MRFLHLASFAAALALTTPAAAQPVLPSQGNSNRVITAVTAEQLAQIFTAASLPAHLGEVQKSHLKYVRLDMWSGNFHAYALPLGCGNEGCLIVDIFMALPKSATVDSNWVNAWNTRVFGVKAYLTKDAVMFQSDVLLYGGVTPRFLSQAVKYFKLQIDKASQFKP